MTAWIMFQGYLIATGQSSSSMTAFTTRALKVFIVIVIATTATGPILGKSFLNRMGSLSDMITSAVAHKQVTTDANAIPGSGSFEQIDSNLTLMQTGLSAIKGIDTGGDQALEAEKSSALMMSAVGAAGPGIVAGVLLLLNKVAMALFVGLAPVFIMCFAFKQTEPMFWSWLKFGITSMFSLAVLTFMTGLAMDMVARLAGVVFVADLLGTDTQGITSAAMQQGGLGLILSTLLITVPPMAGGFFSASLGSFSGYNHFGGMGGGGNSHGGSNNSANTSKGGYVGGGMPAAQTATPVNTTSTTTRQLGGAGSQASSSQPDTIKTNSHIGNAQTQQSLGAGATATGNTHNSNAAPSAGSYSNASESVASKGIGDDSAMVSQKPVIPSKTEG